MKHNIAFILHAACLISVLSSFLPSLSSLTLGKATFHDMRALSLERGPCVKKLGFLANSQFSDLDVVPRGLCVESLGS